MLIIVLSGIWKTLKNMILCVLFYLSMAPPSAVTMLAGRSGCQKIEEPQRKLQEAEWGKRCVCVY